MVFGGTLALVQTYVIALLAAYTIERYARRGFLHRREAENERERSERLRAASDAACRRRWRERIGSHDDVLVDRPGRGYADDYTPWLVEGPVGEVVRARAERVTSEGIVGVAA